MRAVIPEGTEVPAHERPSSLTVFSGTLGVNPGVWREEAVWHKRRGGPFPEIPFDRRDTPYSRLYATEFPQRKIPGKYSSGTRFERPG
ncbi:MAG: hypothetical protein ACREJF_07245 [Candidatus Methylomirabilales bacterium]